MTETLGSSLRGCSLMKMREGLTPVNSEFRHMKQRRHCQESSVPSQEAPNPTHVCLNPENTTESLLCVRELDAEMKHDLPSGMARHFSATLQSVHE